MLQFLDSSKEGVILFSLETNTEIDFLDEEKQQVILKTFAELPYKILWKTEKNVANLPDNVKLIKLVPQQEVLSKFI